MSAPISFAASDVIDFWQLQEHVHPLLSKIAADKIMALAPGSHT
jgi:hypothetical protein